jgi:hypothetical protein
MCPYVRASTFVHFIVYVCVRLCVCARACVCACFRIDALEHKCEFSVVDAVVVVVVAAAVVVLSSFSCCWIAKRLACVGKCQCGL